MTTIQFYHLRVKQYKIWNLKNSQLHENCIKKYINLQIILIRISNNYLLMSENC